MAKRAPSYGLLKTARKRMGLTQAELGDLLGKSRNTIREWEAGKEDRFIVLLSRGLSAYHVLPNIYILLTGPCLAAARTRFGWHQDELADRLGVSRPTLSRWENSDQPPLWVGFALAALAFSAN